MKKFAVLYTKDVNKKKKKWKDGLLAVAIAAGGQHNVQLLDDAGKHLQCGNFNKEIAEGAEFSLGKYFDVQVETECSPAGTWASVALMPRATIPLMPRATVQNQGDPSSCSLIRSGMVQSGSRPGLLRRKQFKIPGQPQAPQGPATLPENCPRTNSCLSMKVESVTRGADRPLV